MWRRVRAPRRSEDERGARGGQRGHVDMSSSDSDVHDVAPRGLEARLVSLGLGLERRLLERRRRLERRRVRAEEGAPADWAV
jgi:hypothetical protein